MIHLLGIVLVLFANPVLANETDPAALLTAATHGDPQAQYFLGAMYVSGHTLPADPGEAVRWMRRAAEGGHPLAQHRLGTMLAEGFGELRWPRPVEAYYWVTMAARQGLEAAHLTKAALEERMSAWEMQSALRKLQSGN